MTELSRQWTRDNAGNKWYYTATLKSEWSPKIHERQLGTVQRIKDQRSPNYNRWVVEIPFAESMEPFLSRKSAMAYVIAVVRLS